MREHKYRFWKDNTKEMLDLKQVLRYLVDIVTVFEGKYDNFKPLQYTGLKDKNGVEIYEADVVTFNDFDSLRTGGLTSDCIITGKVVFAYGMWIVKSNDNEHDLYQALINDEEFEVIGNIYENPELLLLEQSNG
ncbi:hypothetical protein FLK61_34250 [Paenalkalicoccus suaedae]|uniref:YopX protein domain-containing protein n=1 Tax=Paenalkalicoccus suaedae TaxID=2592382 RepID=A0A859FFG5_9BACI|nr:YopX family protein [Paenalkalicoccus suaedae]QKS71687.1 hypothetical protein FLK61_33955 [Paenalkalicoccus suaedae]QKS71741.1 hypothetical protein FLK61_34250 [Paenalkalicoccus suaedae]